MDGKTPSFLQFTPDSSASTSEVFTITQSAAPTSGFWQLQIGSELSGPLAYNANAAAIKAAVEAMNIVRQHNFVVTASAALSAGTTPTLTFAHSSKTTVDSLFALYGVPQVVVNRFDNGGTAVNVSVALTTRGNLGFAAGTYTVFVYGLVIKDAYMSGGDLKTSLSV
jgi:hypothetical protein